MKRCPYCKNVVWWWQAHPIPGLHQWCLDTFLRGYVEGIKVAAVQAAKAMAEYRKRTDIRIPDSQMVQ